MNHSNGRSAKTRAGSESQTAHSAWGSKFEASKPTASEAPFTRFPAKLFYEPYGMLENPFGGTPDPRYLYESRSHGETRSSLIVGLECGVGFQVLIAPPGMGKTTILFDLLDQFGSVARTAFLFQPRGDYRDFLRYLMSELGEPSDSDLVTLQDRLNRLLSREHHAGRRTIVIVDEAQSLHNTVLETLRLLSNFETPTQKLLQIVLAGQPQLAKRLAAPDLKQLHQRISILKTLVPLDLLEMQQYIDHRLKIAGYCGQPLFTSAALRLIWETSHGVPREINTICFNALLILTAIGKEQADESVLREVIADLEPMEFGRNVKPQGSNDSGQSELTPASQTRVLPARTTAEESHAFSSVHLHFYNFSLNPFDRIPDPSFLCLTSTHWKALAGLYAGILNQQGTFLLIGGPGVGKSLVLTCVMKLLNNNQMQADYVLGGKFSKSLLGPGAQPSQENTQTSNSAREHRQNPGVLFIDNAESLSLQAWREIRLFTEAANGRKQIVIAGRPEIEQRINPDEVREFKKTISVEYQLQSLTESETKNYIACRLGFVQTDSEAAPLFSEDAITALCHHSQGNPRLINFICEAALIKSHALKQRRISAAVIQEAAKECDSGVASAERVPRHHPGCRAELLKAAGVLLDLHMALKASKENRHSRAFRVV